MKVFILFAITIASIWEKNRTVQTVTQSLAKGQTEISDVSTAEKLLLFKKLVPLLDAMEQIYDESEIMEYMGKISLQCFLIVEDEPKLIPFSLILASVLYSTEKKHYQESKAEKFGVREFYVKELPLYARLITKFSKLVNSAYSEHYDLSKMSEIIGTVKSFVNAFKDESSSSEFNDLIHPFMDTCVEMISLVDMNRDLFLLYFEGIQATINDIFEQTEKIARHSDSKMAKKHKHKPDKKKTLPGKINDKIRTMKLNTPLDGVQIVEEENDDIKSNYSKSVSDIEEENSCNDVQRRRNYFDFKNIGKKLLSVTVVVSVLLGIGHILNSVNFNTVPIDASKFALPN